jgi:hypothetical protein
LEHAGDSWDSAPVMAMRVLSLSKRINRALSNIWRKYIADEDPDERIKRVRHERIAEMKVQCELITAMLLWDGQLNDRLAIDTAKQMQLLSTHPGRLSGVIPASSREE